jgi:hypothetical protein
MLTTTTGAEEPETWKDLKAWGYNEQLELVNPPSRAKEGEEKEKEDGDEVAEKIGELKIEGEEKEEQDESKEKVEQK